MFFTDYAVVVDPSMIERIRGLKSQQGKGMKIMSFPDNLLRYNEFGKLLRRGGGLMVPRAESEMVGDFGGANLYGKSLIVSDRVYNEYLEQGCPRNGSDEATAIQVRFGIREQNILKRLNNK